MDSEFVTSRGKIALNSKRLLIQDLKFDIGHTIIGEMMRPVMVLSTAIVSFLLPGKAYGYLVAGIFLALFFSSSFKQLYIVLFRKSYSNYIPLNRIISFELKPDELGLETEVRIHLKNGRYRSINFRTLEKQYEPFVELVSQCIAQPQLTCP